MRRQRHQLQRLDVRPHDRPSRGERVCGGSGRRRHDDAVTAERTHLHIVHPDRQLDHLATVGALQGDVVQRPVLQRLMRTRQPHIYMGDHALVMVGDAPDRLAHLETLEFGQKTDMTHVHAENRHLRAMHQFSGPQYRAIAAKHHDDLGVLVDLVGHAAELRRLDVVDDRHLEPDVAQPVDRLRHHRAAFTQTRMRHHHCMPSADHRTPHHHPKRPRTVIHNIP